MTAIDRIIAARNAYIVNKAAFQTIYDAASAIEDGDAWEAEMERCGAWGYDMAAAKAAEELLVAGRAFFGPMRASVDAVFAAALGDGRKPSMVAYKRLLELMLKFDAANSGESTVPCILSA
jgi:hydrogenase maturation factor HypF (carbamoyltransferase family)